MEIQSEEASTLQIGSVAFRLLLSMNSLQSLSSYCVTPSLSRSSAISVQYTKSFTVEKK